jgi:hypothetical protein
MTTDSVFSVLVEVWKQVVGQHFDLVCRRVGFSQWVSVGYLPLWEGVFFADIVAAACISWEALSFQAQIVKGVLRMRVRDVAASASWMVVLQIVLDGAVVLVVFAMDYRGAA